MYTLFRLKNIEIKAQKGAGYDSVIRCTAECREEKQFRDLEANAEATKNQIINHVLMR